MGIKINEIKIKFQSIRNILNIVLLIIKLLAILQVIIKDQIFLLLLRNTIYKPKI
jgi:hypothetical protein